MYYDLQFEYKTLTFTGGFCAIPLSLPSALQHQVANQVEAWVAFKMHQRSEGQPLHPYLAIAWLVWFVAGHLCNTEIHTVCYIVNFTKATLVAMKASGKDGSTICQNICDPIPLALSPINLAPF